jgi:hypothetical protein
MRELASAAGCKRNHRTPRPVPDAQGRHRTASHPHEGTNRLVGRDPDRIVTAALDVIADPPAPRTPACGTGGPAM